MKVLLPVDNSELALTIMPTVKRFLQLVSEPQVHLVTVLDPDAVRGQRERADIDAEPVGVGRLMVSPPLPKIIESHGEAMERVHREAQETLASVAQLNFSACKAATHVIWSADPVEAIVALADSLDTDVIAMATHGRSGMSHLVAGSVAEGVIRKSGRPVLVQSPAVAGR